MQPCAGVSVLALVMQAAAAWEAGTPSSGVGCVEAEVLLLPEHVSCRVGAGTGGPV